MTEATKLKYALIPCSNCGGDPKNHEIIREYSKEWEIERAGIYGNSTHQICKCAGCNTIRFRSYSWDSEGIDWRTGEPEVREKIYPEDIKSKRQGIDVRDLPDPVARIYRETVIAFNAGALILAGGGLRALVEALYKNNNVSGGNLEKKIDSLVEQGLLAIPQAKLLHEERYLGNAALHEIVAPSVLDVNDGFDIIDNLLASIYILPDKARRLRAKRSERSLIQQVTEQSDADGGFSDG